MRRNESVSPSVARKALSLLAVIALLITLVPSMALAANRGAWAPNTAYATNDTVTYGGSTYSCRQGHTSLTGWEPPNVPALWSPVQGGSVDTQAPSAPTGLIATGTTSSSVSLSWSASTDNVGVTGYDVYRGSTLAGSVSGTTLSYTNTGLTANTSYSFTVKAKDAAGNVSAASSSVSATTAGTTGDTQAPTAPSGLSVTATTSSSVSLSWTASTDNVGVTGYDVYNGSTLATSVTGTTATVSGLAASTVYSFTVKAKDAAGNVSTASSSASGTTQAGGGGGGSIPKHVLTGYWQNFINNSSNLKLSAVPSAYDIIAVAFADMDTTSPGGVKFTIDPALSNALGGYTDANLISDIQAKHAAGKKVILSVGGQNGNIDLSSASPNVSNFVNSMYGLITKFGFDGIDIDLENGMNVTNLTNAVRQLQQKVGSGFILTMAPQTIDMQSNGTAYMQFYSNFKDITTVINVQYYNSGCMLGRDGKCYSQGTEDFITALSDLSLQWVAPSQLGLGLPATTSAAGGGYVTPATVSNAVQCLATGTSCGSYKPVAKYPDIRGAMTWSINWDATSNYNFANTVKPVLSNLP